MYVCSVLTLESPDAGLGAAVEHSAAAPSNRWSQSWWFWRKEEIEGQRRHDTGCEGTRCKMQIKKHTVKSRRSNTTRTCSLGRGTRGRSLCRTSRHSAWHTDRAVWFSCKAMGGGKKDEDGERRRDWAPTVQTVQSLRRSRGHESRYDHRFSFFPFFNTSYPSSRSSHCVIMVLML